MCMPMRPNKAETAVQGCHTWVRSPLGSCLGDMAVCTPDRGLVFERVTCFCCSKRVTFLVDCVKCVSIPTIKNRMTHPLQVAKNCTTHPLPRVQKLMTHPLSAPAHPPPPPILFDQSLTYIFLYGTSDLYVCSWIDICTVRLIHV